VRSGVVCVSCLAGYIRMDCVCFSLPSFAPWADRCYISHYISLSFSSSVLQAVLYLLEEGDGLRRMVPALIGDVFVFPLGNVVIGCD